MLPEVLVPIRLDIDMDGQKLRDTFTWNKNGTYIHTYVCTYMYTHTAALYTYTLVRLTVKYRLGA